MHVALSDRIGVDLSRPARLEGGIVWATAHGVQYTDIQLDTEESAFTQFDDARTTRVRAAPEPDGMHLGFHTLSAESVTDYSRLRSEWAVLHVGYLFTSVVKPRMQAGLDRLQRIANYAGKRGVHILLENLNKEPTLAEVHYHAHIVEESLFYYERVGTQTFWPSFTANHAHLGPQEVAGFVYALPWESVTQVRLADCFRNGHNQYLPPNQEKLDFPNTFHGTEATGIISHYMNAFGPPANMPAARDTLATMAE